MKLYSVFLGFGFMLLAGVSSDLQKCNDKSGLTHCWYTNPYGNAENGMRCVSDGGGGDCGNVSTCIPVQ